jgi:hypothetical protein
MAQPTNLFDTYDSVGRREDLQDLIYNISPTDTQFLSSASKGKAKAIFHEWQTDTLETAATNRAVDGDEATADSRTATVRLGNYCQISRKVVGVSGTVEAVDKAGRKSEMAYHMAKSAKELKRDMEVSLTTNQASSAGGSSTARSLASVESWIATNKTHNGSVAGTTPGYSSGTVAAPTDGTQTGSFTEATLKALIKEAWTQGGDPGVIMVGPVNKQKASAFSGIATQYRENSGQKRATILGAADVYISDFGEHRIVANRFSRDRTVLGLDMDYWGVHYLRPFTQEALAKTGDSDKKMLLVEYTLVARNEKASFKIADVGTT